MFAIVTSYDKFPHSRRYRVEFCDPVCRISIGSKLSRRRLERLLRPFGGRILFAADATSHRIKQYDTSALRRTVLFCQFYDRVMSENGISLSVGIVDPAGDFLSRREMTEIIAHSAATTVFTFKNADRQSQEWLLATGTCPEIVEKKALVYSADIVFAPEGLTGYEGELFGLGGNGIDREDLYIPDRVRHFLSDSFAQIDKTDLYCMLNSEADTPCDAKAAAF